MQILLYDAKGMFYIYFIPAKHASSIPIIKSLLITISYKITLFDFTKIADMVGNNGWQFQDRLNFSFNNLLKRGT